jgi:formylglycine-generating enzyme required for sulfatase activity
MLQIARWIGPVDLLRAAPAASPLQDRVFLGFMAGQRDQTWLEAPRALMRLFTGQPVGVAGRPAERSAFAARVRQIVASLRFQAAIHPIGRHVAAAAAVGLVSLLPLTRLLAVEEVAGSAVSMWFVEIPEVENLTPGADGIIRNLRADEPFFISRTEVTVGQYNACIADGACVHPGGATGETTIAEPPDWPVRNVSWQQAQQYCEWLERKLKSAGATGPVADALAGRRESIAWDVALPSGAEWIKAATLRGGRRFPWGLDDIDDLRANIRGEDVLNPGPAPVGSFPRDMSGYGVVDMTGNVAEWIRDSQTEIIGGSFASSASELEAQFRPATQRTVRTPDPGTVGFRVVVTPEIARQAQASAASTAATPEPTAPDSTAAPAAACVPRTGGVFAPVYFAEGSTSLSPAAERQLDAIANELRTQKGVLTMEGHSATARESKQAELQVDLVGKYLTSRGIDRARLRGSSMGTRQPQCSNETAEGRDANRRVEFRFSTGNSAPTIRRIRSSPTGIGLPPTEFTFTVDGAVDPDGDALSYEWTVSGYAGAPARLTGPTVKQTLDAVGSYTVSVTATDSGGASARATAYVSIGTITGTWNIECLGAPSSFPTSFVASIRQDGSRVSGTLQADGRSQTFPAPNTLENTIRPGRQVSFGVEGGYNVWGDSDFYFSVTVDDSLETFTGTSQYCRSVRGVRQMTAMAK